MRDALEENSYDVDAAINFILQLICVAEETGKCFVQKVTPVHFI